MELHCCCCCNLFFDIVFFIVGCFIVHIVINLDIFIILMIKKQKQFDRNSLQTIFARHIEFFRFLFHLLGVAGLTHLCKDVGQFFTLPLATDVCTETSFAELQCTLILRDFQQFHASLFVRSVANNFTNQITNEFRVLGLDLKECNEKHKFD